jgi:hypothetical protein
MPIIISPNRVIYPNLINPFVYTVDIDDVHEALKKICKDQMKTLKLLN